MGSSSGVSGEWQNSQHTYALKRWLCAGACAGDPHPTLRLNSDCPEAVIRPFQFQHFSPA